MKKTLLATAILTGLVSATAGAATVYDQDGTKLSVGGRAEVRGLFGDAVEGTMEDKSRARINFKGETQITDDLTGFGVMEYEIKSGDTVTNRYLYAGLGTVAGDFSYGKQDTANVQISAMTDIASAHSGNQQYIDSASERQDSTFFYANNALDENLSLQANFIAANEEDKDDAFAVSALFSTGIGLDLGASYSDQDQANQITLAAGYTFEDLYLGTSYAMGDVAADDEFTSLEVAAQYKVTKELRMIGIYTKSEEDVSGDTADFFALEGQYRFNDALRTYASYKFNNLTDGEDELLVGLRYNF
ncbi:MAG: porin [Psychromonas sp.]